MRKMKIYNAEVQELLTEIKKSVPDIDKQLRIMELIGNAVNSAYDAGEEKAVTNTSLMYQSMIADQQNTINRLQQPAPQLKIPAFMLVR